MAKRIIIIVLVLGLCNILLGYEFEILEMSESYIKVGFELPDYTIEKSTSKQRASDKINITDSELTFEEKEVVLPYFADAIGIPEDGDIDIRVLTKRSKTYNNLDLERCPVVELVNDKVEYRPVYPDSKNLQNVLYPQEIIKKGDSAFIGDRRFTSFQLYPFQYNELKKTLTVHEYIEFEVLISGDTKAKRDWKFSDNFIDKIGDEFFMNNRFPRKWKKELTS